MIFVFSFKPIDIKVTMIKPFSHELKFKFKAEHLMAIYIMFVRDGGVNGTWGFFNLIFVQNLMYFLVGVYTIYINKLGHTEKTNSEGVVASAALTILSAVLIYGLSDKIYIS